jgi:GNAT superfamily N-acetyltransferase
MRYPFYYGGETVGHFELNQLPGNAQIIVSNHSCIYEQHRGKGLGQVLSEEKLDLMQELGFDYSIATVRANNEPQMRIMEKNGWTQLDSFYNREGGQEIIIFGRRLSG